jgi:uncharacterized membrane protein (DUF106 family)
MTENLSFYFAIYWRSIVAWIPVLLTGLLAAAIICLIIYITRKLVDRQWAQEPEKLQKAAKVKLRCYEKEINRLQDENDELKKENGNLRAVIRAGIEQIQQAGNILGGKV